MFLIKLIDIGEDGCVTDWCTSVDTLAEAEEIVKGEIGGHLGTRDIELVHIEGLLYDVISGGRIAGGVHIQSL